MNRYDDIKLNIQDLIKNQDKIINVHNSQAVSKGSWFWNLIKLYFKGFLIKTGIHQKLIYSNLSLTWFYNFRNYWISELGGRPINPHDFYFLLCHYRQKFQNLEVKNDASPEEFLKAWQDYRNIYNVFSYVFKTALRPLGVYKLAKYIPKKAVVCEYGCGIAPISQGLIKYYSHKKLKIHCADIPNFLFHFVRWNLRDYDFVKFIKINPEDKTPLKNSYDAITILAVLEHLPNPLVIIENLYDKLKPDGILAFDYIISEGEGLDTKEGVSERKEVLNFIEKNFEIVKGKIDYKNSMDLTIAKRK